MQPDSNNCNQEVFNCNWYKADDFIGRLVECIAHVSKSNDLDNYIGAHSLRFYNWDFSANKNISDPSNFFIYDISALVGTPEVFIQDTSTVLLPIVMISGEFGESVVARENSNPTLIYTVFGSPVLVNIDNIYQPHYEFHNNVSYSRFMSHGKEFSSANRIYVFKNDGSYNQPFRDSSFSFYSDPSGNHDLSGELIFGKGVTLYFEIGQTLDVSFSVRSGPNDILTGKIYTSDDFTRSSNSIINKNDFLGLNFSNDRNKQDYNNINYLQVIRGGDPGIEDISFRLINL